MKYSPHLFCFVYIPSGVYFSFLQYFLFLFLDKPDENKEGEKKLKEWAVKIGEWEEGAFSGTKSPEASLYLITVPNKVREEEMRTKLNDFFSIKEIVTLEAML